MCWTTTVMAGTLQSVMAGLAATSRRTFISPWRAAGHWHGATALDMTKWFDTDHRDIVPKLEHNQSP
jgi:hypothetical protein